MNSIISNEQSARAQLQFLRMPCEILCEDGEPLQLPKINYAAMSNISPAKQSFFSMVQDGAADLNECDDCANYYDSDPEILLSDSEDEDEDIMDNDEADAETDIDSEDLSLNSDEERLDTNGDFEAPTSTDASAFASFEQILSTREDEEQLHRGFTEVEKAQAQASPLSESF
jgi:hypothetical protein